MNNPLLIAHRGDSDHFPENTIQAFQSAFDLGADGVEFDVHLTDGGELIVVHEYLYDRTKIFPTLSEVLEQFSRPGRLEIEIKSFDPQCVEKVSQTIEQHSVQDFEVTSSILPLLPVIRRRLPHERTGIIFNSNLLSSWMTPDVVFMFISGYLELTKTNVLHMDLDKYTPEIADGLHKRGYILHTHLKTADLAAFCRAKNLGIDQCSFDDINLIELAKRC